MLAVVLMFSLCIQKVMIKNLFLKWFCLSYGKVRKKVSEDQNGQGDLPLFLWNKVDANKDKILPNPSHSFPL